MSSTKIREVYPPGDPNVKFPPTFSSLESIVDWVVLESVYAEKFKKKGKNFLFSWF